MAAEMAPTHIVVLDVTDDNLVKRVVGRRLDPETGTIYHVDFKPPPEGEVADRCIQRSDDTEEKAKVRIQTYKEQTMPALGLYKEKYADAVKTIDGNGAPKDVWTTMEPLLQAAAATAVVATE